MYGQYYRYTVVNYIYICSDICGLLIFVQLYSTVLWLVKHKYTWICPGRGLQSIIDYFLIRGDTKRNVNDVKVTRGAEIGSDHHLVLMKLKLCGRVQVRKVEKQSRLRSERLTTEEGKLKSQIRLGRKLNEAKWTNGSDVEKMWEEFKDNAIETAEVVCGRIKYENGNQRTRWWGKEVELSVRKKKLAFKRWLQLKTTEAKEEYLRAKRAAGHEVRKAKNDEWRRLGESLQGDYIHDQKRFWASIRSAVKGTHEVGRICDESGQVLCE